VLDFNTILQKEKAQIKCDFLEFRDSMDWVSAGGPTPNTQHIRFSFFTLF